MVATTRIAFTSDFYCKMRRWRRGFKRTGDVAQPSPVRQAKQFELVVQACGKGQSEVGLTGQRPSLGVCGAHRMQSAVK